MGRMSGPRCGTPLALLVAALLGAAAAAGPQGTGGGTAADPDVPAGPDMDGEVFAAGEAGEGNDKAAIGPGALALGADSTSPAGGDDVPIASHGCEADPPSLLEDEAKSLREAVRILTGLAVQSGADECALDGVTCGIDDEEPCVRHVHRLEVPVTRPSDLGVVQGLAYLRVLILWDDPVAGTDLLRGKFDALKGMSRLAVLRISSNSVYGRLAALTSLRELEVIDLGGGLIGDLQDLLERLPRLRRLALRGGLVDGNIRGLAGLANLAQLRLDCRNVHGDLGVLAGLTGLTELDLAGTQVSGSIMELKEMRSLRDLSLRNTRVWGEVTDCWSPDFPDLALLDVSQTLVGGDIAHLTRGLPNVSTLVLSKSRVYGNISALWKLRGLRTLDVGHTAVKGQLRDLQDLPDLQEAILDHSDVRGTLADLLGLGVRRAAAAGAVVMEIGVVRTCAALEFLDIADSRLKPAPEVGELMDALRLCQSVTEVLGRNTTLWGSLNELPPTIVHVDLQGNQITRAELPPPPAVRHINLAGNSLVQVSVDLLLRENLVVDLRENPQLSGGRLLDSGVLHVDAGRYNESTGCCSLREAGRVLVSPETFGRSRLCRCHRGFGGTFPDCQPCRSGTVKRAAGNAPCETCWPWQTSTDDQRCKLSDTAQLILAAVAPLLSLAACVGIYFSLVRLYWERARKAARELLGAAIEGEDRDRLQQALGAAEQAQLPAAEQREAQALLRMVTRKYVDFDFVFHVLRKGDTKLVKGSWLVDKCTHLVRRQDLPEEAFWDVEDLRECLERVEIVAVSYCWLSKGHPDPGGQHLRRLQRAMRLRLASGGIGRVQDLAVFLDFLSLYQEPRQSDEERAAFKRGLREVNLWYVHQRIAVWLHKWVPDDSDHNRYDDRGWPVFENLVSQMVTDGPKLIELNKVLEWLDAEESAAPAEHSLGEFGSEHHVVSNVGTGWWSASEAATAGRLPPVLPESFNVRLQGLKFTNGLSDREFVSKKYGQTFSEVFGSARDLWFVDLGWGDEEAVQMARVIPSCSQLRMLSLSGNRIASRDAAVELLKAAASVPTLQRLYLQNNPVARSSPGLQELWAASGWEPRAMLSALEGGPPEESTASSVHAGRCEEPGPSAGGALLRRLRRLPWRRGGRAVLLPEQGLEATEIELSTAGLAA